MKMKKTSPNTHLQTHLQSSINRTEWCRARQARFPARTLVQISLRCLLGRRLQFFPVWALPRHRNHRVWTKPRCCTRHSSKQRQASQPPALARSLMVSIRSVQFQQQVLSPARILLQSTRLPRLQPASQRSLAASLIPTADSPTAWQTQQSTRSRLSRPLLRWIHQISFPVRTRLTSPHILVCRRVCPGRLGGPSKLITNSNKSQPAAKYVSTLNIHHDTSKTHAMKMQLSIELSRICISTISLNSLYISENTFFFLSCLFKLRQTQKTSRKIKIIKYKKRDQSFFLQNSRHDRRHFRPWLS